MNLPSEEAATRAIQETNTFVLNGKPLIVVSSCSRSSGGGGNSSCGSNY